MTDKELNVYQKLQKARIELQNSKIKKSGKNAYAGFTYFELKDFIPTVNELFDKYGLSSNFSIVENVANLFIVDTDKPEENILFTSPIAETQLKGCTPIQALGAVHTYMKRYLYLNAFEITEDDLLDSQAGNIKTPEKKGLDSKIIEGLKTLSTIKELNTYYDENKKDIDDLKAFQTAYSARAKEIKGGNNEA